MQWDNVTVTLPGFGRRGGSDLFSSLSGILAITGRAAGFFWSGRTQFLVDQEDARCL